MQGAGIMPFADNTQAPSTAWIKSLCHHAWGTQVFQSKVLHKPVHVLLFHTRAAFLIRDMLLGHIEGYQLLHLFQWAWGSIVIRFINTGLAFG